MSTARPRARRRRLVIGLGVAAAVVALIAAVTLSSDTTPDTVTVEYAAVDQATGEPVDLSSLAGQPVLLTSWATWCGPCAEELPAIQRLYEERRDEGFEVVAVNVNAAGPDEPAIAPMAEEFGLTMPQWRDRDNDFAGVFDGVGVPNNVLVGADGAVVRTWQGAIDVEDEDFLATLDEALASSTGDGGS